MSLFANFAITISEYNTNRNFQNLKRAYLVGLEMIRYIQPGPERQKAGLTLKIISTKYMSRWKRQSETELYNIKKIHRQIEKFLLLCR